MKNGKDEMLPPPSPKRLKPSSDCETSTAEGCLTPTVSDSLSEEDTKDCFDETTPHDSSISATASTDAFPPLPASTEPNKHQPIHGADNVGALCQGNFLLGKHGNEGSGGFGSEVQTPLIDGSDPIEQLRDLCGASVGSAEECGKRMQMEDVHAIIPNLEAHMEERAQDHQGTEKSEPNYSMFCVLDGHSGDRVSQFVVKALPLRIKEELAKIKAKKRKSEEGDDGDNDEAITTALHNAYVATDKEVTAAASGSTVKWKDGSTALTVIMKNSDKLYVANIGDCRAVLGSNKRPPSPTPTEKPGEDTAKEKECFKSPGTAPEGESNKEQIYGVALTNDHHPEVQSEADRIKKCGGYVSAGRLMGLIEVSRAFGDLMFRKLGLISEPEVTVHKVNKTTDKFLIIASDGIWKVISNDEAVRLVQGWLAVETDIQTVSLKLIHTAYDKGSTDNATVIIIVFSP